MIKDRTKNIIITGCGLVEAYLIYLAQGVTTTDPEKYPSPFNHKVFQPIYAEICGNVGDVALGFIVVIIFLQILFGLIASNDYKEWISKFFRHVIDQDLGGQNYETRITLYIERKGVHFLLSSTIYAINQLLSSKGCVYFSAIPNPFNTYLFPYSRFSYPEKATARTTFRALNNDNDTAEGAVEKCYKTGKDVYIKAPYINDIKLPKEENQLTKENMARVKEYIATTGISYKKLRLLQRKANCIYAIPLRKGAHIWGVLVFDNNSENTPIDLKDKLKNVIDNYQKIIQLTIEKI